MASDHPSAADIVDLYDRKAEAWIEDRGQDLHEAVWLDRLLADLPSGAAVLDAGCGSGQPLGAELARRGFAVTGVDASPRLIERARSALPDADLYVADMRTLDLGAARFDAILAWHSLFHLTPDDQGRALERLIAHAKPSVRLMFTAADQAGEAIGEWRGEPLYHASLAPEAYRSLMAAHDFTADMHVVPNVSTVWIASRGSLARPSASR